MGKHKQMKKMVFNLFNNTVGPQSFGDTGQLNGVIEIGTDHRK